MDPKNYSLLAQLPGLQLAKQCIEQQIADIERRLYGDSVSGLTPSSGALFPIQPEKKKRNLSPEVRERKRLLVAQAREAKLKKLRQQKEDLNVAAATAPVITEEAKPQAAEEKTPGKRKAK